MKRRRRSFVRTVYYRFYFAVFGERVHALESSTRNVSLNEGGASAICRRRRRRTFCVVLGFLLFVSSSSRMHVSAVAANECASGCLIMRCTKNTHSCIAHNNNPTAFVRSSLFCLVGLGRFIHTQQMVRPLAPFKPSKPSSSVATNLSAAASSHSVFERRLCVLFVRCVRCVRVRSS